jgi:hypothetical protein
MLPDNVLLEIFDFYQENDDPTYPVWKWHILVHVCRRWRQIVFASPHRLNLQIHCSFRTPVRNNLGIWPILPIVINYYRPGNVITPSDEDNVIAALEHLDRVCDVRLVLTGSESEKITTVMQQPFPVLMSLHIWHIEPTDGSVPVLPVEFLGGSAPRLQEIYLRGCPFPALPTLLLSSSDLVTLHLRDIPPTGYISPKAMVAGLAALPRLTFFIIELRSATSRPDRMHPPPVTRTVLPALTAFHFRGASEYLEDFVARIDGPQVNGIYIRYLNQLVDFQVAQLPKFFDRSLGPKLTLSTYAQVNFYSSRVSFNTYCHANDPSPGPPSATTVILCEGIDFQVSHIAQVLSQFWATLSNVVHLKLNAYPVEDSELECTDVEWVHLLCQFPAVHTLHVSRNLAGHVALALEDIAGEIDAEPLPSLDSIYLPGQLASSVEKFVAARKLSDRPVTVLTKTEERLKSYVSK